MLDLPRRASATSNLGRARVLQRLMERSGEDLGVPLKVSVKYHPETWSKGASA